MNSFVKAVTAIITPGLILKVKIKIKGGKNGGTSYSPLALFFKGLRVAAPRWHEVQHIALSE